VATLQVDVLNGVDDTVGMLLQTSLKGCTNSDILCACMYLLTDLPYSVSTLSRIGENLLKLFPPGEDKDFDAGKIRGNFNAETKKVKGQKMLREDRLWCNPGRGCWQNTQRGNAHALRILRGRGIVVLKRGVIQNP